MPRSAPAQHLATYFHQSDRFYFAVFDPQGKIISVNPLFRRRFEQLTGDFRERDASTVFCTASARQLKETIQACLGQPGNNFAADLELLPVDHPIPVIHWEFSASPAGNGVIEQILAIGTMTESPGNKTKESGSAHEDPDHQQISNEQSELFYRSLFSNSLDGVLLTDERGWITFASPSITPILGYSIDEITGTNTFEYAHPDDRDLAVAAFMDEVNNAPKTKFISIRLLKKSGDWLACLVRGHNLMENPNVRGIVVYFYDDTMRKETEPALIQSEQSFSQQ